MNRNFVTLGIAVGVAIIGLGAFAAKDASGADDFFSSTQTIDARAGAAAGIGNTALNNPGFNPCSGAAATMTTGECTGTTDATALLNPSATGNLKKIFIEAGPGSITDNMFGLVSGVALGADGLSGGTGVNSDTVISKCAPLEGATNFDGSAANPGLNGLNCGALRITPDLQGQTIPSFPSANSLTGNLTGNADLKFDSNPSNTAPATNSHTGMNLTNRFAWIPTATGATTLAADGIDCTANASATANAPNFCSKQTLRQVTALGALAGTEVAPGADDQVVDLSTSFQFLSNNALNTDSTGFPTPATPFTVTFSGTISDPDMSGSGGLGFKQTIAFTFGHNAPHFGVDGIAGNADDIPQAFACPGTVVGNICTQYPTGQSLTDGSITAAELPPQ